MISSLALWPNSLYHSRIWASFRRCNFGGGGMGRGCARLRARSISHILDELVGFGADRGLIGQRRGAWVTTGRCQRRGGSTVRLSRGQRRPQSEFSLSNADPRREDPRQRRRPFSENWRCLARRQREGISPNRSAANALLCEMDLTRRSHPHPSRSGENGPRNERPMMAMMRSLLASFPRVN